MVTPIAHRRVSLTGNVRGRPRRFGSGLIMQVEEQVELADPFTQVRCPPPPGRCPEDWAELDKRRMEKAWRDADTRWRDATCEDQLALAKRVGSAS